MDPGDTGKKRWVPTPPPANPGQHADLPKLMMQAQSFLEKGKAYISRKQPSQARREYQRAYSLLEQVLRGDPDSQEARNGRAECLRRIV